MRDQNFDNLHIEELHWCHNFFEDQNDNTYLFALQDENKGLLF